MNARRVIVARLSEDSMGGIATLQDVEDAEQLVDAVVAEELNAAADEIDRAQNRLVVKKTVVNILRRRANQGDGQTSPTPAAAPDFFQKDHLYTVPATGWRFRCVAVTTHPDSRERVAIGWQYRDHRWEEWSYDEPQWAGLREAGGMVVEAVTR